MAEDRKWLIKSSNTILGPFELDHVVESLFKGEIHILDEIKSPFDRCCPIKDNSLLTAALEKLKSSTYNRREQTVTATDITTTREMTATREMTTTREMTATREVPASQTSNEQKQKEFILEKPVEDKEEFLEEEEKKKALHPVFLRRLKVEKIF